MATQPLFRASKPLLPIRGIHLDLKGTPPTPGRLLELLRVFAAARYNAVLVEWEDAFPWTVDPRFRSPTAYTLEQVRAFHETARELGLEIIPLIQCLGHMETPLNLPDYAPLREIAHDSFVLHPLAQGARELVQKMIDDVVDHTPGLRYLHLGGDEAWSLGQNPASAAYMAEHGKGALYLQHVEPLLDSLIARGIRPILWHDMMIDWEPDALRALARKADLNAWGYREHPDQTTSHYHTRHIQRLHDHGFALWGGTAYKGADGHNIDRPVPAVRQANALAWVDIAQRFNFTGVIATAWSRYSTHRVPCEPIDAALDLLFQVGVILHDGEAPAPEPTALLSLLDQLGEKERYLACRSAMEKLSAVRVRGWTGVQSLREQIAMSRRDPRRIGSSWEARLLRIFRQTLAEAEEMAEETRRAFDGLIEPVWIEDYLHCRLQPLRTELTLLDPEVRLLDPAAWEAEARGEIAY